MGRNSDRVELFRQVLNKACKKQSIDEMLKDPDYLNMALNLALFETSYEKPINVINIYGYPCIVTNKSLFLVKPILNNTSYSTLEPTGRYKTIEDEEVLDKLVFEAETSHLIPKVIIVKIWTNIGFVSKEDEDFKRTRGIPFRNRIHYYKCEILGDYLVQTEWFS